MFEWCNKESRLFLSRGYLLEGETVEGRVRDIAQRAEELVKMPGLADKIYKYAGLGCYSFSSPVWANFGRKRGLPISCNGSYFGDSIESILTGQAEVGMMTKHGAGTSGYYGHIRPRGATVTTGGVADGPAHYAKLQETLIDVISQGSVRRGNFAAYLDVEHPDFDEFIEFREVGSPMQQTSIGVCISDEFMRRVRHQVRIQKEGIESKRWLRILRKRFETGYPYLFFTDTVNRRAPQAYQDQNLRIHASNLCSEITQPSSEEWSFVCCLSSINVSQWQHVSSTDAIECLIYLLDAVIEEYIQKTEGMPYMHRARQFAIDHRGLGLGQLGWHTLLQKNQFPFDSFQAMQLNAHIAKTIWERSKAASQTLAKHLGEPKVMEGYGMRNATLLAIAPTTSSSFILGQVSPSVEPLHSNYFIKDLAKGKFTWKNPLLRRIIGDDERLWKSIIEKGGSVQHLDCLDDHEKRVFECFAEIPQVAIINQAAQRQTWIDQSQSINLMVSPKTPLKNLHELMFHAWESGVKTLYYQRGFNPSQELNRDLMNCSSCEG